MGEVNLVAGRSAAEALTEKLLGRRELPAFLFDNKRYTMVFAAIKEGGEDAGMAYGVIKRGETALYLHFFYIKKEYRDIKTVTTLLELVFKTAAEAAGVKKVIWKYALGKGERDPRPAILRRIPCCGLNMSPRAFRYTMLSRDLGYLRRYKFYKPEMLAQKGYSAVRWPDCGKDIKGSIHEREKDVGGERGYLSPFIDEDGDMPAEPDGKTSFVLARRRDPVGWALCEKMSESFVALRRFFIYTNERVGYLGQYFGAYVLDAIAGLYEGLRFTIVEGNRQMERFCGGICKPIVELNCVYCDLIIDLREENQRNEPEPNKTK